MANRKTVKDRYNKSADAQKAASRLPDLDLDARKLAGIIHGLRKRSKAGQGTEFFNFRPFVNGIDSPHKIDWKSSASKTDHTTGEIAMQMRDREMEVTQNIYIWFDESEDMDYIAPASLFPEQPRYTKKEAAMVLSLATAYLAVKSGERFTLLNSGLRLIGNKGGVDRLRMEMEHGVRLNNNDGDLPNLFVHRGKPLPQNSHVFIFSDFLYPLKDVARMISSLHHAGVKGHLVQVLDPAEIEFRFKGRVELKNRQNGETRLVNKGESSRHEIEQYVHQHVHDLGKMIKNIQGWSYSTYITDQPLHEALLPLYGLKTNRMPKPTMTLSRN